MATNNALHEALVRQILLEVSKTGLARLWVNHTGVGLSQDGERFIQFGLKGSADITGILKSGQRIEIEVKTGSGKQSEQQVRFQKMIEQFGGVYILARSVEDVLEHESISSLRHPQLKVL